MPVQTSPQATAQRLSLIFKPGPVRWPHKTIVMLQPIKCIQSNDPKALQQAYSDLWNALENGEFEKDSNAFFKHRTKFRELMMIDPSQKPVTSEMYVIKKDSFGHSIRGIALYHKSDKETLIGVWNEETGHFSQFDGISLDMADISEVVEVNARIEAQGFDEIFKLAIDQKQDEE